MYAEFRQRLTFTVFVTMDQYMQAARRAFLHAHLDGHADFKQSPAMQLGGAIVMFIVGFTGAKMQ